MGEQEVWIDYLGTDHDEDDCQEETKPDRALPREGPDSEPEGDEHE